MKKFLLSCAALTVAACTYAQDGTDLPLVLDLDEDTTQQVVTIADIVSVQERVTTNNTTMSHFNSVWGRKKYFNITYGNVDMKPKEDIPLGYTFNGGKVPTFKSDWGLSIKLGRNYSLHKKPIANTLMFNINFNYFDLNVTHFKTEGADKEKLYDSSAVWNETDEDGKTEERSYIPWCLQKYKADFGMAVGPSLTIAPFNYVKVPGLHYIKLDVYYNIGYHASVLWMVNDDKRDANPELTNSSSTSPLPGAKKETSTLKLNWGHGLTSTFGFSLSWKMIGIGYEIRNTKLTYKSTTTDIYGHRGYKFDANSGRIYLQIRY